MIAARALRLSAMFLKVTLGFILIRNSKENRCRGTQGCCEELQSKCKEFVFLVAWSRRQVDTLLPETKDDAAAIAEPLEEENSYICNQAGNQAPRGSLKPKVAGALIEPHGDDFCPARSGDRRNGCRRVDEVRRADD